MSRCPNCDMPITAAPWRYDDADHGVHWVCPADDTSGMIYAPISLSEAIRDYMDEHPRRAARSTLIG